MEAAIQFEGMEGRGRKIDSISLWKSLRRAMCEAVKNEA
jgi:hypothetical protein